jgi:hypothetical protein
MTNNSEDMKPEYDLRSLRPADRTRYDSLRASKERIAYQRNEDGSTTKIDLNAWREQRDLESVLEPDLVTAFPSRAAVNDALRKVLELSKIPHL